MTRGRDTVLLILRALCFLNYLHSWATAPAPNGVLTAWPSSLASVCDKNLKRKGRFGLDIQTNKTFIILLLACVCWVNLKKKKK